MTEYVNSVYVDVVVCDVYTSISRFYHHGYLLYEGSFQRQKCQALEEQLFFELFLHLYVGAETHYEVRLGMTSSIMVSGI